MITIYLYLCIIKITLTRLSSKFDLIKVKNIVCIDSSLFGLFSSVPCPAGLVHVAFGLFFIYNIIPQQGLPLLYIFQKKRVKNIGHAVLCQLSTYRICFIH
jgi:hypothetical protein